MSIDYYCGHWPGLLNAPPPCSSSSSYICIIFCQGPFWPSTKYTFLVKVHKMLYSSSTLMWISLRCPALLACNLHDISWKILKLDHIICIYVNLSMSPDMKFSNPCSSTLYIRNWVYYFLGRHSLMAGLRIPIQFFGKTLVPVFEVNSPYFFSFASFFFHLHHF